MLLEVEHRPCSNHKLALSQTFKTHNLSGPGSFESYVTENTQGKEEQSWLVHATSTTLK